LEEIGGVDGGREQESEERWRHTSMLA
jgi:hypothetical protein